MLNENFSSSLQRHSYIICSIRSLMQDDNFTDGIDFLICAKSKNRMQHIKCILKVNSFPFASWPFSNVSIL